MNIKLDVLLVQIVHVLILFWVFKKLIWNSLTDALQNRKSLMSKLLDADKVYEQALTDAQQKADEIIQDWMQHRNKLIEEGKLLAEQKAEEVIEKARHDADSLIAKIKADEDQMRRDLEENFAMWVRRTTEVVVKKLLKEDTALKNEYMDQLIKEVIK